MSLNYYINQTVLGGTSAPRYPDPLVTGEPNEYGLYPWSNFRARFASYDPVGGGVYTDEELEGGDTVCLLLFTSDIPAMGYVADDSDGAPRAIVSPSAKVGISGGPAFFKTAATAGTDVTVSAGQVGVGYVATGEAAPNAYIATTGFPANVYIAESAFSPAEIWVWANSPNIASPISFQNWDTVVTATAKASGFLPIILRYSTYTQAIRDAGNVVISTDPAQSNFGATYQVVGLYGIG
jgi:hypothetical protein